MGTMALDGGVDPTSRWGRERHLGPAWHMESMWRGLPSDILETMITFLPLASLLRFKTVSKKWNNLISHPEFASRHARSSSPEEYVLVAVRFEYERNPIRGWEVLDLANKKFFTLSIDFLTEYAKREGIVPTTVPSNSWQQRGILAADGGLFCVSYSSIEQSSVLLVCNPVLQTVKRLPNLTGWVENHHRVVMSTDRISMEYEVYIVNDIHHQYRPKTISIYESKTGIWRWIPNEAANDRAKAWCSVTSYIEDKFYDLYCMYHPETAGILSFDKVTSELSDPGVVLPSPLVNATNLYLVGSKHRLFCVARWASEFHCYPVDILEIILAEKKYKMLTRMPEELVRLVFGEIQLYDPFTAVGCVDSILICSVTGRSVAYSLSKKSWYHYPQNSLREAYELFDEEHQEVFGSNYCLSLCAPSNFDKASLFRG